MMRIALLVALAACGDNLAAPPDARRLDAHPSDARTPAALCHATFSGNFAESEVLPANCAALSAGSASTRLGFAVPSQLLGTVVAIQIELPDPAVTGSYSPGSVSSWSATATQAVGTSRCYYIAGAAAVPPGDFTLALDAVDETTAHGQLMLELAVLPGAENDCGSDNAEQLALAF
jgi:hypothetical protein